MVFPSISHVIGPYSIPSRANPSSPGNGMRERWEQVPILCSLMKVQNGVGNVMVLPLPWKDWTRRRRPNKHSILGRLAREGEQRPTSRRRPEDRGFPVMCDSRRQAGKGERTSGWGRKSVCVRRPTSLTGAVIPTSWQ